MSDKIYVIYVGITNVNPEEIDEYVKRVSKAITPPVKDCTIITIPVDTPNTRIECINPIYITNYDLIKQHSMLMFELNYELQEQIKLIRNEKN